MHFSLLDTVAADRGHPHTISLKLRDMNQLFNSMDPSPFIEKDLDIREVQEHPGSDCP
jgi:hypothetical protein